MHRRENKKMIGILECSLIDQWADLRRTNKPSIFTVTLMAAAIAKKSYQIDSSDLSSETDQKK